MNTRVRLRLVPRSKPSPKPAVRSRGRQIIPVVLLVAVGVGAYWNGLRAPFVWDDDPAIVTNQTIRTLLPLSDSLSPPLETPMAGRPIANLSLALSYAMGGLDERRLSLVEPRRPRRQRAPAVRHRQPDACRLSPQPP